MQNNEKQLAQKLKTQLFLDQNDLLDALEFYTGLIQNDFDRFTILVHLVMIQTNFLCIDQADQDANQSDLSINLAQEHLYNKLVYNCVYNNCGQLNKLGADLILIILKSGVHHADITLKCNKFKVSLRKNINFSNLLAPKMCVQKVNEFCLNFKNEILNPFRFYYSPIMHQHLIKGFLDLPAEIVYKLITNYLDIKSIISLMQCSTRLFATINHDPTSQTSIWAKLLHRDYKKSLNTVNYRDEYIRQYESKRYEHSFRY